MPICSSLSEGVEHFFHIYKDSRVAVEIVGWEKVMSRCRSFRTIVRYEEQYLRVGP